MTTVLEAQQANIFGAMLAQFRAVTNPQPKHATPGELAKAIDPRTVQTPALDLIDAALVDVAEGRCERLIITMAPQEGKSERVSRRTPLWLLTRDPELRIAIASYEHGVARRWGRAIRNDIAEHPKLGLRVRQDTSAAHEWQLAGHRGGVYCVGIGGALTGRPVDWLLLDDPIKDRKQADSLVYRDNVWEWWTNVARTRLAPGAPVVLILTRWHEDDLAGRLLAQQNADDGGEPWRLINIPAQADHRPEKGETDPLGRAPGEWMISARGRTPEQFEKIRAAVGPRTFTSLYQGRPAPAEGTLFKRGDWRFYKAPIAYRRDDGSMHCQADVLIQSWDMTFKDSTGSDFVVGQVWARRGAEAYLLDQVRARMDFPATCHAVEALAAKWPQATAKLVEDKANGPAVIAQLRRTVSGLIAVEVKDSKYARASAVAPFVEAHNVLLPDPTIAPWVADYIEEHAGFPNASHDDQVDTTSQALHRLLLAPAASGRFMDQLMADRTTNPPPPPALQPLRGLAR